MEGAGITALTLNEARVQSLFGRWQQDAPETSKLVAFVGTSSEEFENKRSLAMLRYVFNYPNIVSNLLFAAKVEANKKKVLVIHGKTLTIQLPASMQSEIEVTAKNYNEDSEAAEQELVAFLGISAGAAPSVLAAPGKELLTLVGQFGSRFYELLKDHVLEGAKIFSFILAKKDAEESVAVLKAGALARSLLQKYMQPQLLQFVEKNAFPSKQDFAADAQRRLENPQTIPGLESMSTQGFSACLVPPIVQSGGKYALAMNQQAQMNEPLSADVTIFSAGAQFNGYCTYIARTYLFPPKSGNIILGQYDFVLAVHNKVVELLTPGKKLSDVYAEAAAFAREQNETFASRLEASFGSSCGLCVLEARYHINEKATAVVEAGNVYIVRVCLEPAPVPADDGASIPNAAILLADTVIIEESGSKVATKLKKDLADVTFRPAEEEEVEEEKVEVLVPRTRANDGIQIGAMAMQARKEKQREILTEKRLQWEAAGGKNQDRQLEEEDITCYEVGRLSKGSLPDLGIRESLTVDIDRQATWLPVGSQTVPFHISTIQKAELKSYGNANVLTVTFHTTQEANVAFRANRGQLWVKELTVAGSDRGKLEGAASRIGEVIAAIKSRDANRKRSQGTADERENAKLQLNRSGGAPRLTKVKCRPTPPNSGKTGCQGDLEAHINGFQFKYLGGAPITIMYSNVKLAIFQSAEREAYTIFHLLLKQGIMLGNKKVDQIQFLAEVVNQSEASRNLKRTHEEELAQDDQDELRIKATNREFAEFCRGVERVWEQEKLGMRVQIGFTVENTKFSFSANCGRTGQITFRGNSKALWSLSEMPFFCYALDEVEVAALERVGVGVDTFDLKLLKKDYRTVWELNSIPKENLDRLKDYFNSVKILYIESGENLHWTTLLKEIRDDKDWEPWAEDSGWGVYLDSDSDEEDEEDDDDSDEDSDDDSDDDDEESEFDSSDAELVSDDSSISTESSNSDDDWDEMERKAEEQDRRRGRSDDESDDSDAPRRKKARGGAPAARGGAGGVAPPRPGGAPAKAPLKAMPKVAYGAKRPMPPPPPPPGFQRR